MPLAVRLRRPPVCCAALFAAFVSVAGAKSGAARVPADPPVGEAQKVASATGKRAFLPDLLADLNALTDTWNHFGSLGTAVLAVQAHAKAGDAKAANKLLGEALLQVKAVPDDTIYDYARHDVLRLYAWAQIQTGDTFGATETLIQAKRMADEVKDEYRKVEAFIAIAEVQAEAGDRTAARETIAQAKQAAGGIDPSDPHGKAVAAGKIAVAQGHIGNMAEAKETASTVSDSFQKSYALFQIAAAQAKKGGKANASGSKETFLLAKQAASAISSTDEHKPYALALIAQAQAQSGDKNEAAETLSQAEQANVELHHEYGYATLLPVLISAKAEAGDLSGAERTFALAKNNAKADAARALAAAYAKAEQWDKITRFYAKSNGQLPDEILAKKALAQARSGAVNEARATVKTIRDRMDQVKVLCSIIVEIAVENKPNR